MIKDGKTLVNCGEDGATIAFDNEPGSVGVVSYYQVPTKSKNWTSDEIIALLNDGMRYRLLKKAEKIKKEE